LAEVWFWEGILNFPAFSSGFLRSEKALHMELQELVFGNDMICMMHWDMIRSFLFFFFVVPARQALLSHISSLAYSFFTTASTVYYKLMAVSNGSLLLIDWFLWPGFHMLNSRYQWLRLFLRGSSPSSFKLLEPNSLWFGD
jgi:hypothetical protein